MLQHIVIINATYSQVAFKRRAKIKHTHLERGGGGEFQFLYIISLRMASPWHD